MRFTITLEFDATDEKHALEIAEVLREFLAQVPEHKLIQLHELMKKQPDIIARALDKISSPLFQKLLA